MEAKGGGLQMGNRGLVMIARSSLWLYDFKYLKEKLNIENTI